MGRQYEEMKIIVSLSRHNSDQDEFDNSQWQELRDRIKMICREKRYENISPMVF